MEWEYVEPYLPIGEYGPYPARLRKQFEGVIWKFRSGAQWCEMPAGFGPWSTVHNRFRQWRDARVFETLLEELIAQAAARGEVELSLVSVDSTARAHHDAAGVRLDLRRARRPGEDYGGRAAAGAADSSPTTPTKERNTVERLINKLKAWRGIATRYDKTPRELPRRPATPRLDDLDQRPRPDP